MPMFPRHPVFLAGAVVPVLSALVVRSIFGTVNPAFNERVSLLWFIVSHIAVGTVTGLVVSRSERIRTWQHIPFLERAGIERNEVADDDGGANV